MASDVQQVLGAEHTAGLARICRYTPRHGCAVCIQPIDLRVEHASVLLRVQRDGAGRIVRSASILAHALCAPSQVSPWGESTAPQTVDPDAVPGDLVKAMVLEDGDVAVPVLLVELGMVSPTVTRTAFETETVTDRMTEGLLADGLNRLWTTRQVAAGLRQLEGWSVCLSWDGRLGSVRCPSAGHTGQNGVFLLPTDTAGPGNPRGGETRSPAPDGRC